MITLNPHHAGSQQHLNIHLNLNAGSLELLCENLAVISEHPGAWTAAIHHCYSGHSGELVAWIQIPTSPF